MTNIVIQDTLAAVRNRLAVVHKVCELNVAVWIRVRGSKQWGARALIYTARVNRRCCGRRTLLLAPRPSVALPPPPPSSVVSLSVPQAVESVAMLDMLLSFTGVAASAPRASPYGASRVPGGHTRDCRCNGRVPSVVDSACHVDAPNPPPRGLARAVRPQFTATGPLHIVKGRHPILDRLPGASGDGGSGALVPNDVYLGPGANAVLITGPNASGKST